MVDMQWFKDETANEYTLALTANGTAQDITGATCTLECDLFGGGSLPLTIVSASGGTVLAKPSLAQLTAATTGTQRARVRVAFANAEIAYFPKARWLSVEIGDAP